MNALLRLALFAGAGSLLWAGFRLVNADMGRWGLGDLMNLPALHARTEHEVEREVELTETQIQVLARIAAKRRLVFAMVRGERGLLETAAQFRDLDHSGPAFTWVAFRLAHRGDSDDERHCREVLSAVEAEPWDDPCAVAALLNELASDLERQVKQGNLELAR